MKILKWLFIIWSVTVTFFILLGFSSTKESRTESSIFCAYGMLFVEFEENGKRWGTIMLNYDGKPFRCSEEEIKFENTI